jgi:hypothetical protein
VHHHCLMPLTLPVGSHDSRLRLGMPPTPTRVCGGGGSNGLVWFGLVWIGMDWYGMIWYGYFVMVWLLITHSESKFARLDVGRLRLPPAK